MDKKGLSRRGVLAGSAAVAAVVASGDEARAKAAAEEKRRSPQFRRVDLQK